MNEKPKILFYDIETAPSIGAMWRQYDSSILWTETDWYLICFAYKWGHEDEVNFVGYPKDKTDKRTVKALHALLDEADIVVAHNGDRFDQKMSNARFLFYDLPPPSPYQSIDTLKVSKAYFRLYSHSLDEIGRFLKLGRKVKHQGVHTWRGAMEGEPASWETFEQYNLQDVALLEQVYLKLVPWLGSPGGPSTPNLALWGEEGLHICPKCGHDKLVKRGFHRTSVSVFQTYQCKSCKGYSRSRRREPQENGGVELR